MHAATGAYTSGKILIAFVIIPTHWAGTMLVNYIPNYITISHYLEKIYIPADHVHR